MRTRPASDESGFSLVELMVVVLVFGVLSAVVGATLINAMGGTRRTQERTYRSADVQKTLELISKDVRVAIPITSASPNDLSVEVYRNGTCTQRRWYLDVGTKTLVETSRNYAASTSCLTAAGAPGGATSRVLLRDVQNSVADPLFTFYVLTPAGLRQEVTALPVAAATLPKVRGVVAEIRVAGPENSRPVNMTTSVELRNG